MINKNTKTKLIGFAVVFLSFASIIYININGINYVDELTFNNGELFILIDREIIEFGDVVTITFRDDEESTIALY